MVRIICETECFSDNSALSNLTGRRVDRSHAILTHPRPAHIGGINRGWKFMNPIDRHTIDAARARFACEAAAFALGCSGPLMSEGRGDAKAAFARQVAMYLTHVAFGMSLQRVGFAFARDRSTVAHACHLIEDRRDDAEFDNLLDQLEASLRAAPAPARLQLAA
jgi:hypothetical protein